MQPCSSFPHFPNSLLLQPPQILPLRHSSALATVSGSAVTAATARGAAPRVDSAAARAARRDSRRDKGPGQAVTDASPQEAQHEKVGSWGGFR